MSIVTDYIDVVNDIDCIKYPSDCMRIVNISAKRGYTISLFDAEVIWSRYSDHEDWEKLPDSDKELEKILFD